MFDKIRKIALIAVPLVIASCGGVSSNEDQPGGNSFVAPQGIEVSTPATVPVFAGTDTHTGLWIHNNEATKVSRIYVTASPSSVGQMSTGKAVIRSLIKKLPVHLLAELGVSNPDYNTGQGFIVDEASADECKLALAKGAGTVCYLKFQTPVVQSPTDNDYVLLHVVDSNGVDKSQIISWGAISSADTIDSTAFLTKLPGNIQYGRHATVYVYTGAKDNFTKAQLNLRFNPVGVAYVSNGYTGVTEMVPGEIIPVELVVTNSTTPQQVSAKSVTAQAAALISTNLFANLTLENGVTTEASMLGISPGFANRANLVTGIMPPLFLESGTGLNTSYSMAVLNNSDQNATTTTPAIANTAIATVSGCSTGTLTAGTSCTLLVTAKKAGTTTLSIPYSSAAGGESVLGIESVSIQVFDNRSRGAFVIVTTLSGDIQLAESKGIGAFESAVISYSVFNDAQSKESTYGFNIVPGITGTAAVIESSTKTGCTAVMAIGANCTATIKVKSASSSAMGTGVVYESYSYTTAIESTQSLPYTQNITINKYTVYGDPTLIPASNTIVMSITGDNTAFELESVLITNTGTESAIIESPVSYTLLATPPTNTLKIESVLTTCKAGKTLQINESCLVYFQLGPKSESVYESAATVFSLKYDNAVFGPTRATFSSNIIVNWEVKVQDVGMKLINIESLPIESSGIGTVASPMIFLGGGESTVGAGQKLRLTFKNTSTIFQLTSQAFNLSALPSAWSVDQTTSTCGTISGATAAAKTINAESTCTLVLMVNRPVVSYLANGAGVTSLTFAYPPSSWQESPGAAGIDYESTFSYNGEASFTSMFQNAQISTVISGNTALWESVTMTQTLLNDFGKYNGSSMATVFSTATNYLTESAVSSFCVKTTGVESTQTMTCTFSAVNNPGVWKINTVAAGLPAGNVTELLYNRPSATSSNPLISTPAITILTR